MLPYLLSTWDVVERDAAFVNMLRKPVREIMNFVARNLEPKSDPTMKSKNKTSVYFTEPKVCRSSKVLRSGQNGDVEVAC
jgi:hypothetical protein